jgi:uncharacterized protein (UPF0335 family)
MKTKEEIEQLAEEFLTFHQDGSKVYHIKIREAIEFAYTQCQQDMADKIKEVYEQGLSDGYACMPSTISPLNKQD